VKAPNTLSDLKQCWIRICGAAVTIGGCFDRLGWDEGSAYLKHESCSSGRGPQPVQGGKEVDRAVTSFLSSRDLVQHGVITCTEAYFRSIPGRWLTDNRLRV
jgi:hypothetical protein